MLFSTDPSRTPHAASSPREIRVELEGSTEAHTLWKMNCMGVEGGGH